MRTAVQRVPNTRALPTEIDIAKIDAQRNIANARLNAFADECFRLGDLVKGTPDRRIEIIDFLQDVAEANGLSRAHGEGLIHIMIAAGLRGAA